MLIMTAITTVGLIGIGAGAWRGIGAARDYEDEWERQRDAADLVWRQAQERARVEIERAQAMLTDALGALGEHRVTGQYLFGTGLAQKPDRGLIARAADEASGESEVQWAFEDYDDWYNQTYDEYQRLVNEDGLDQSWDDYLREQQLGQLGEYGIVRAELELTVQIAERRLELAREHALFTLEIEREVYEAGVVESYRQHRHEGAMAAASGMRSGAGHTAVQEYHAIRTAELDRYLRESEHRYESRMSELELQEQELRGMEETALLNLDRALAQARQGYEWGLQDIEMDLRHLREQLDAGMADFSTGDQWRTGLTAGLQGATDVMEFTLGLITGLAR